MDLFNLEELPRTEESEQAALILILKNKDFIQQAADVLKVDDFYNEDNKIIFSTMLELHNNREEVDIVTLTDALRKNGHTDILDQKILPNFIKVFERKDLFNQYISNIVDVSIKRNLILNVSNVFQSKELKTLKSDDFVDIVEKKIFEISCRKNTKEFLDLYTLSHLNQELIERNKDNKKTDTLVGLATGYKKLDSITQGLQGGQLIILAARPGMGKSAFAINIGYNCCILNKNSKCSVAFFSLEMPSDQIVDRIVSSQSQLPLKTIKSKMLSDEDLGRFRSTVNTFRDLKFYFDDSPEITVGNIKSKCRRLAHERGLDLIIVDYLQLITSDFKGQNVQEETAKISRQLKLLAMELEVPVIALSQLSRNVEKREDKRPLMSDLRDSGSIEQDADIVMFLYRDEYYNAASNSKGYADLLISKNRNGEVCPEGIKLRFETWNSRFCDE